MRVSFDDPSLPGTPLADSGFTFGWTLETLFENCGDFQAAASGKKVKDVSVAPLGEGQGFVSVVYQVTVNFSGVDADTFAFVAKVPSARHFDQFVDANLDPEEAKREMFRAFAHAHNGECAFYDAFRELRQADCIPLPRVWFTRKQDPDGTSQPGIILMEDLSSVGSVVGIVNSVTVEQTRNVTKCLAQFHAYLLANAVDSSRIVRPGYHFQTEQYFQDMYDRSSRDLVESDSTFQPLLEKVKTLATIEHTKYAIFELPKELDIPCLLVHGDCWANNIIFKTASDGQLLSGSRSRIVAFIDWQAVTEGNPMFDIAAFLAESADGDVRREAETFVVQLYYDELTSRLRQAGKTVSFGVEKLQHAYKSAFIVKAMEAVTCPPMLVKRITGLHDRVKEAHVAKLELRAKLVLEDAVRYAEDVGAAFLNRKQ